jgi:hypothetical protein
MKSPPRIQIGDRVRTLQQLHRLPIGSIGTIAQIFGTDGLLGVLFPDNRVPRFVYHDQLEILRPQDVENGQRADTPRGLGYMEQGT